MAQTEAIHEALCAKQAHPSMVAWSGPVPLPAFVAGLAAFLDNVVVSDAMAGAGDNAIAERQALDVSAYDQACHAFEVMLAQLKREVAE